MWGINATRHRLCRYHPFFQHSWQADWNPASGSLVLCRIASCGLKKDLLLLSPGDFGFELSSEFTQGCNFCQKVGSGTAPLNHSQKGLNFVELQRKSTHFKEFACTWFPTLSEDERALMLVFCKMSLWCVWHSSKYHDGVNESVPDEIYSVSLWKVAGVHCSLKGHLNELSEALSASVCAACYYCSWIWLSHFLNEIISFRMLIKHQNIMLNL